MDCPVCKNVKLVISERQNIEIDYCPNCRGVWLDRGELDKIIERAASAMAPAAAPQQQAPQQQAPQPQVQPQGWVNQPGWGQQPRGPAQQSGYPAKKRKSFLDDLFDFD